SVASVMIAVITLGSSAAGVRVVISPSIGPLISGPHIADTTIAARMAPSGTSATRTQIGSAKPRAASDARTSGSTRFTTWQAGTVPITPPRPYAANSQPPTFASP